MSEEPRTAVTWTQCATAAQDCAYAAVTNVVTVTRHSLTSVLNNCLWLHKVYRGGTAQAITSFSNDKPVVMAALTVRRKP